MNRIIEVKLSLEMETGLWRIDVTKEFEAQYGGGTQTFTEYTSKEIHFALDVARGMVTLHPGRRTDL